MNIRYLWIIMLSLSIVLFMFQVSIENINPEGATTIYNYNGSILQSYDAGDYNIVNSPDDNIPELPAEISTESSSSGFTDIFQSITTWFKTSKAGQVINGLYYAFPNLIKGLGLPEQFAFALGILYHLLAVLSFVMFTRGIL